MVWQRAAHFPQRAACTSSSRGASPGCALSISRRPRRILPAPAERLPRRALVDVATPRISTDCARDYGKTLDFWQKATPEQKRLVGMDDSLLRIAIWAAANGQHLYDRLKSGGAESEGGQAVRQVEAADARKRGKAMRNQLYSILKLIAGGHKAPPFETR